MSDQAKHTPGPWNVYNRGIGFEIYAGDNRVNDGFRDTFSIEDARLIAAAPELLEVVKELIGDIYLHVSPSCQKELIEYCMCRQCTHDRAKAAIAKAEEPAQ